MIMDHRRKNNTLITLITTTKTKNSTTTTAAGHGGFNPNNPFTFCNINNMLTSQKEHQMLNPVSRKKAQSAKGKRPRTNLPVFERLHRNGKGRTREGYFRKLKG